MASGPPAILRLEPGEASTMRAQAAWLFGQGLILFTGATVCLIAAARIFYEPEHDVRAGLWPADSWLLTKMRVT